VTFPMRRIVLLGRTTVLFAQLHLGAEGPLPISRSSWWRALPPDAIRNRQIGPRITAWRVNDLRALIENAR